MLIYLHFFLHYKPLSFDVHEFIISPEFMARTRLEQVNLEFEFFFQSEKYTIFVCSQFHIFSLFYALFA